MRDTGHLVALVLVAVTSSASVRQWFFKSVRSAVSGYVCPADDVAKPFVVGVVVPAR